MQGKLIVLDGIAGSGKSTLIRDLQQQFKNNGTPFFDTKAFYKETERPPSIDDVGSTRIIFSFEPTYWWIGRAIRDEFSFEDPLYTGLVQAQAFSLDRLIQYKRLIIPALEQGKIIIQDRSVTSSIVYQPVVPGGPTLEDLLALPGNELALQYPPDHLILTSVSAETAQARQAGRNEQSKGVFVEREMLEASRERFASETFQSIFTKRGTVIHTIETDGEQSLATQSFNKLIESLLQ